jgi:anti-sigma B factor antagonist
MDFAISHQDLGAWTVVTVSGEVDMATGPTLRDDLLGVLARGGHRVVLDLSKVTFMDSSGLGALLGGHRRARLLDGEIRLAAPSARVLEILRLTNLDRVFDLYLTVAAAAEHDASEDDVRRPAAS